MLTATLYNEYVNPETKKTEWRRTLLTGKRMGGGDAVHWKNSKAVNVIKSGLATADAVTVMIWFSVDAGGKEYLPPKEYAALTPAEADGYWTLWQGHDRMVKGVAPEVAEGMKITDIVARYDDCMTIKSVDTMDFGSPGMRHWEVSGQ